MIDWPNLLVGALLGAVITAIPWAIDHSLARRNRRADVLASWASAAKQIEILLWTPDASAADLFKLWSQFPIDSWRRTLGPEDFRALEEVQRAFHASENALYRVQQSYSDERQAELSRAYSARQDAAESFSNRSREMWSESYARVTNAEAWAVLRDDYRRHPFATLRRELRNRRTVRNRSRPS